MHRDIKPTNLFLPSGSIEQVKLLDFGIARRIAASIAVTRTGLIVGTPEYMAPEQVRGVRELTPAIDVFSLGCVLYECLTGEPPFVAEHIGRMAMTADADGRAAPVRPREGATSVAVWRPW